MFIPNPVHINKQTRKEKKYAEPKIKKFKIETI